jgi:CO/xanthine dehydrogenase Mo-binding subunit
VSAVGSSTARSDGPLKVRGQARYAVDVEVPGMLHCVIARTTVAAGRIVRLNVSKAQALPGVHAVITAVDAPTHRTGLVVRDQQIFASTHIRYEGEPIAAVAAETKAIARRAVELIEFEFEEITPMVDLDESVAEGARLVHPDWQTFSMAVPCERYGNVAGELFADPQGVDSAFAQAAHVVVDEYRAGRQYQAYLEPKSVVAEYASGRYLIQVSHQFPFSLRDRLAEALGVRSSDVRVVGHYIGGAFGAKLDLGIEPYAALLAKATGRAVKLVQERTEDLITCPSRENAIIRIRSAVDVDGKVLGRDFDVLLDAGAAASETPFLCSIALFMAGGAYRVGPTRVRARAVYTNTAPTGAFRGVSGTYLIFAVERHLDHIAEVVGVDRMAIRLANVLNDGDKLLSGQSLDDASILSKAFAEIEKVAPWTKRTPPPSTDSTSPLRGIGIAATVWLTNPLPGEATLRLADDGTIYLISAANDNGSGAVTMGLRQIAAEEFGLDVDDVTTTMPDTDTQGFDGGSQGSRTTHVVGRAVHEAAIELRQKILDVASKHFEADVADLEIVGGAVGVRGVPSLRLPLSEIAMIARGTVGPLGATASYAPASPSYDTSCATGFIFSTFPNPTYHVHLAEVEVDQVTGNVSVTRYIVAQEVGKAINPAGVYGQIQGGVTQGLGYALYEGIDIGNDGRYQQRTLASYRLPLAPDIPRVEALLLEHPNPDGPFGAKGVAEPPIVPVAAAIANAISAAVGYQISSLPIHPNDVLDAIEAGRKARQK